MIAPQPIARLPPAPRKSAPFMPGSPSLQKPPASRVRNRSSRPRGCVSHPSADLAGRSVALSPDIAAAFDAPLAPHHKLIGRWVASQASSTRTFTRGQAREHIERVFDAAVHAIIDPIELADLHVAVVLDEDCEQPAIALVCRTLGQIDLGWIETGDAPIPWRAAAYDALEQALGHALPVIGYDYLFEEISMYYWEGETDDDGAREALIANYGASQKDLESQTLPSTMNARRPAWMLSENAAPPEELPVALTQKLKALHDAATAMSSLSREEDAWRVDSDLVLDYFPEFENCAWMPSLTIVPFEQFAPELDDITRPGMENGFMDVVGLFQLPDEKRIPEWFATLKLGARLLLAAQDLIQFDPANS